MWRPFFLKFKKMTDKKNNEELRPTKMRGVVFPKAKYGVILAIIIIILVNLIYYKDKISNFFSV
mgnify:CR=1 FL=1